MGKFTDTHAHHAPLHSLEVNNDRSVPLPIDLLEMVSAVEVLPSQVLLCFY